MSRPGIPKVFHAARLSTALALLALASGCLIRDTHHTLYLAPDGSVTWTVLESHVRSDSSDPDERRREEVQYLSEVRDGRHLAARGLDAMWPRRLDTVLLRDERPFTVHTEARFGDAARMVEHGMRELDVRGDAWIEWDLCRGRLVIEARLEDLERTDDDDASDLLAFLMDVDELEVRLTEGEFVEARGFELREGGAVAVPIEIDEEEAERNGGVAVLSLTWPVRRCESGS